MKQTITILFTCHKCGLMTPGIAQIPADLNPRRALQLHQDCHHCDEPMMRQFDSVTDLMKSASTEEVS